MCRMLVALILVVPQEKDDPAKLVEAYSRLDLEPKAKGQRQVVTFDEVDRDRVDLERRLVACGKAAVKPLMETLKAEARHSRAMAAHLLGVIGEKAAGPALADVAAKDKEALVRGMAIQSLAWMKLSPEVIKAAEKDVNPNVKFLAARAQEQLKADCKLKDEWSVALKRDDLGSAKEGAKAPDFTLLTSEGKPWKLSDQKGIVVLFFQLADW